MATSPLREFAKRQEWVKEQQRQLLPLFEVPINLYQQCLQSIERVKLKDLEGQNFYVLTVDKIRFTVTRTRTVAGEKTYWSVGTETKGVDGHFHDRKTRGNIVISLPKSVDEEIRKIMKAMLDDLTLSGVKRLHREQQVNKGKIGVT